MTKIIGQIIRLGDDTVLVFDTDGDQIPRYQGTYKDVRDEILRIASPVTEFNHWFNGDNEPRSVARGEW